MQGQSVCEGERRDILRIVFQDKCIKREEQEKEDKKKQQES